MIIKTGKGELNMRVRNIETGRDLLNALKQMENLDNPIEVSVFHHPHNDNEMPAIFGLGWMDELNKVPNDGANHILITCTEVRMPGTVDELTKDIDYKTMVNFGDDNSIDSKTVVEKG